MQQQWRICMKGNWQRSVNFITLFTHNYSVTRIMLGTTTFKSVVIQFLNVISKQPTETFVVTRPCLIMRIVEETFLFFVLLERLQCSCSKEQTNKWMPFIINSVIFLFFNSFVPASSTQNRRFSEGIIIL